MMRSGRKAAETMWAWIFLGVLALSSCGDAASDVSVSRTAGRNGAVDPATYAGEVAVNIVERFEAGDRDVRFTLLLGLTPETQTRLGANAMLDLRELQAALPDAISGTLDAACPLGIDIGFIGAEAMGDTIRAQAEVTARLYRCPGRGTEDERRGLRVLSQKIDLHATLGGSLQGECIAFRVVDLDLAPRGLLGGLATLLGVTERARAAILEQAQVILAEHPVCPDLPEALSALDLRFNSFEMREIGNGGIGAALAGSVDLSADTLIALLARNPDRESEPVARVRVTAADVGSVDIAVDETIEAKGTQIPYRLDVRLSAVSPTRIGVEAILDAREIQQVLPGILAGDVLADNCGGRISLKTLTLEAGGADVIARGRLYVEIFDCKRTGMGSWERGELLSFKEVGIRADLSADIADNCVVFRLRKLERDPPGALAKLTTEPGKTTAVRALLMEAVELVLEHNPLCPELPPTLAVLDPSVDRGTPEEIGSGGIGIAAEGSIDVGPETLIDLLRVLQDSGAVPPQP